jgi:hypothetical protein
MTYDESLEYMGQLEWEKEQIDTLRSSATLVTSKSLLEARKLILIEQDLVQKLIDRMEKE